MGKELDRRAGEMGTHSIWELGWRRSGCSERTHNKVHTKEIVCHLVCKHQRRSKPQSIRQCRYSRVQSRKNARKVILINEDVVVCWLARAEYACMAIEIKVCLDWTDHIRVYDRAWAAVPFRVAVAI